MGSVMEGGGQRVRVRVIQLEFFSVKDRLMAEYNHVGSVTMDMVLESCDFNYETAGVILRVEEAVVLVKSEFPQFTDSAVRQVVEEVDGDVSTAKRRMQDKVDVAKVCGLFHN